MKVERPGRGIMEYETIPKAMTVKPKGEKIFHVDATEVGIDDEAGGMYVYVRQYPDDRDTQEIRIGEEDWPAIRLAITKMLIVCRDQNAEEENITAQP
jgi:hypothetical protein